MRNIRAGTEIVITLDVRNGAEDPPSPMNPSGGVSITLTDPNGVVTDNLQAMTNVEAGVYQYRKQTSSGDPKGVWTMSFRAINGGSTVVSQDYAAFKLS